MANLINEVLAPVARIRADKARGSGTIIYSKNDVGTFLLTNYHVIEGNITYKDVWDELLKREIKKEFTSQVEVDTYRLGEHGEVKGIFTDIGDIILGNKQQDLALLQLRSDTQYPTAELYPEKLASSIPLLSELACAGAAMGEKPIVTTGLLNGIQIEIDNYEYWLSSAPSIFGSSGGGVFIKHEDKWLYLGIPSRITVAFIGFSTDAITHMGYFIPIKRIYSWLRDNCYQFLWDNSYTKEECDEIRNEKREKELALHVMRTKG